LGQEPLDQLGGGPGAAGEHVHQVGLKRVAGGAPRSPPRPAAGGGAGGGGPRPCAARSRSGRGRGSGSPRGAAAWPVTARARTRPATITASSTRVTESATRNSSVSCLAEGRTSQQRLGGSRKVPVGD